MWLGCLRRFQWSGSHKVLTSQLTSNPSLAVDLPHNLCRVLDVFAHLEQLFRLIGWRHPSNVCTRSVRTEMTGDWMKVC